MRFLLYSDLQLHPYKEFSTFVNGVNSRLLDHFKVLDQILQYAIDNHIPCIVFGGDMFEARTKVDIVAAKLLLEWKTRVANAGIKQIDIIGNHDLVDKSTLNNALELYQQVPEQLVITQPSWIELGGDYGILAIPYMHRLEDVKEGINLPPNPGQFINPEKSIAIIHYGLYDVPLESHSVIRDLGYDTEGQIRLADLEPLSRVQHIFFGHYHITTSVTPKVHFIGTPLQHKWGERSVETRFLDIDLSTGTFKPIPTSAPRFVEIENFKYLNHMEPDRLVGNFCRVKVKNFEEREAAIQKLLACGALGADAIVVKKPTTNVNRLDLNLGMSFEEMGNRMVDADTETKLDKSRLKTVLSDALKTATSRLNT